MLNKLLKKNKDFNLLIVAVLVFIFVNVYSPCLREYFWGSVLNDILIGVIVSYVFYYVIVYIPNKRREQIIKNNYKKQIETFKTSIITTLLCSLTGGYTGVDGWSYKDLFINKNFKDFFHTPVSETQDRWEDIATNLQNNHDNVNDIVMEFKTLEEESRFVLNKLEIQDERIYVFLKRISKVTYKLRKYDPETDDIKSLMLFLWQIFAGWSWIDGYSEEDIFKIIDDEF